MDIVAMNCCLRQSSNSKASSNDYVIDEGDGDHDDYVDTVKSPPVHDDNKDDEDNTDKRNHSR